MTDTEIAKLWGKLQNARTYAEVYAILKEAFKRAEGK